MAGCESKLYDTESLPPTTVSALAHWYWSLAEVGTAVYHCLNSCSCFVLLLNYEPVESEACSRYSTKLPCSVQPANVWPATTPLH